MATAVPTLFGSGEAGGITVPLTCVGRPMGGIVTVQASIATVRIKKAKRGRTGFGMVTS
jgi:hypothetical protein